ncbi:MAG: peptidoglycan-binding protein [Acidimicrobiales bacterium]
MRRLLLLVVGLAVVAGIGYGIFLLTDDSESDVEERVIVIDEVGRATLQDTVVVLGNVGREDLFTVAAVSPQRVTALSVEVDGEVTAGDELLRLDGRPMLAVSGTTPYWRPLQRFVDDGPDVEMLEQFLEEAGFSPGTVNQEFTNLTRDALEEWQEANGYPADGRFLPTDVAVNEWPAVVGSVGVEVGESVSPGLPLVSFVERDLTISVAVDPTDRSRLDVGLPAVVTVSASDIEVSGRISELADAPEVDGQGVERYAGEVESDVQLDIVDGAAVRVEVILAEVVDAMVVPVASVSLDGSGREEIRVLNGDGTIDRVPVETGLTEGALVEIVDGLDGSEQIVVEVRQ